MNFFKRLEKSLVYYKGQLKRVTSPVDREHLQAQVDLLQEILTYVKAGKWSHTDNALERVLFTLKNGRCAAAEKYNTTVGSIDAGLSKAASKVQDLVGLDVLDTLEAGDVGYARFLFYRNSGQMSELVLDEVIRFLPSDASDTEYDLDDCTEELKRLKYYTPNFIENLLSNRCDKAKLAYLHKLLVAKDNKYAAQQYELYKRLR